MSRRARPTRAEIAAAFNARCTFGCPSCSRACTFAGGYNHRFDCCGEVVAHVMENLVRRVSGVPAYAVGVSTTTRPPS
jgi:hypothetical protein